MDLPAILRDERLPAVVVDLDAFDRNVAHAAGIVAPSGLSLRLATKSVRVPALIRRALDAGDPYRGLMCFSAEEAHFLADQGFDDLLVAYPTLQRSDLDALRELHEAGKVVWLVVDSADGLRALDAAMAGCEEPFRVVLDVDMSLRLAGLHLGVRRSPLRSADDVLELFRSGRDLAHVRLCGLLGYEAQVAGLPDRNPFKRLLNPAVRWIRGLSVRQV
ncbi:MAG: alanine racemase, partial [Myxococcota bacterium]|nr:alanine racemase [Myxococcota bacterium]